jgi:hemolysin III
MPKEGAIFLITARPDLQHLLAPHSLHCSCWTMPGLDTMAVGASVKNASSNISVEEILNSCTHGIGLVLSIAGFVVLLALSIGRGTAWHIVGCAIYGSTLIWLYLASTVYHGVTLPRLKRILKILDHSAIYLLIAGTYTPFLLVNLRGGWGWSLLGIVWGCAMAGIIFKVWFVDHFKVLSTVLYLVLGWLILVAARPLAAHVSAIGLRWLVAGGIVYTVGVVFYASRRIPYCHVVWHLLVMAGSVCHYLAVVYAVVLSTKV